MYRCVDCYREFEEPELTRDPVGEYHGQTAYQYWYVCPHCGSDDYEELLREEDERKMRKSKRIGNMELLRELIDRSGISLTNLAKALEMTYVALNNKLKGDYVFTLDEALRLKKILNLTQSEWNAVFDEEE